MPQILALLAEIAQSATVGEVWELALSHFRRAGFARVNYGCTRFRVAYSTGDPDDMLLLTSLPGDYAQAYFAEGWYAETPMYRWVMENTGVCTWAWVDAALAAGTLSPSEAAAVRRDHAMGIIAGVTISFAEVSPRCRGAIGLIADKGLSHDDVERIWADKGNGILAVANMMHLRILQLPIARGRSLTDRQREALEWVADGKTAQDAAVLMGISPAMVEKHLKLARAALGVETTAQAVAKALSLNIIFRGATSDGAPSD